MTRNKFNVPRIAFNCTLFGKYYCCMLVAYTEMFYRLRQCWCWFIRNILWTLHTFNKPSLPHLNVWNWRGRGTKVVQQTQTYYSHKRNIHRIRNYVASVAHMRSGGITSKKGKMFMFMCYTVNQAFMIYWRGEHFFKTNSIMYLVAIFQLLPILWKFAELISFVHFVQRMSSHYVGGWKRAHLFCWKLMKINNCHFVVIN